MKTYISIVVIALTMLSCGSIKKNKKLHYNQEIKRVKYYT